MNGGTNINLNSNKQENTLQTLIYHHNSEDIYLQRTGI